MSVTQDIRRGLEKRLNNISGIPDIAWENATFDPQTGTEWIRARLQVQSQRQSTKGDNGSILSNGLLLLDIFETESDAGPASADLLADTIRTTFDPGDIITEGSTRIHIRYSERFQGISDSPWYMLPTAISWYSYS